MGGKIINDLCIVHCALCIVYQVYSVIDLEYFEAALDWLLARPQVAGDSLGLCGISKVFNIKHLSYNI